jgi:hypothetical protein
MFDNIMDCPVAAMLQLLDCMNLVVDVGVVCEKLLQNISSLTGIVHHDGKQIEENQVFFSRFKHCYLHALKSAKSTCHSV